MGLGNTNFGFSAGGSSTPPPSSTSWMLDGNTVGVEKYFGTNDNFSIPLYTNGIARGIFLNTGDFGFGTISPTSRVHIVGIDATFSNYALKVDDSASSPLLYVRNDGNVYSHGVGSIVTNTAFGLNSLLSNLTGSDNTVYGVNAMRVNTTGTNNTAVGVNALYNSNGSFNTATGYISLESNTGDRNTAFGYGSLSVNTTGIRNTAVGMFAGNVNSVGDDNVFIGYNANALSNNLTNAIAIGYNATVSSSNSMVLGEGVNVGIGIPSPAAKLHIKGADATSANYALKVDNSASSPLLYVRNDGVESAYFHATGKIYMGTSTIGKSSASNGVEISALGQAAWVFGFNNGELRANGAFDGGKSMDILSNSSTNFQRMQVTSGALYWDYGVVANDFVIRGILNSDPSTTGVLTIVQSGATAGYSGFGIVAPLAKLHIKGADATSANYALKVDNSASSPLLYVRNDGYATIMNAIFGRGGGLISSNTAFGVGVLMSNTTGFQNTGFGNGVFNSNTTGRDNSGFGNGALVSSNGNFNSSFGSGSLGSLTSGGQNSAFGYSSGYNNNGSNGVFLGYQAGYWETASNKLFIDNDARLNEADGRIKSLIYGVFSSALSSQSLTVNAGLFRINTGTASENTIGETVNTTDATANVTAQTIAVATNTVISIESTIVYRKTGGAGVGTTGDGTTIKLNSSVKNVGGTLTLDTVQNTYTGTTNAIVGVSATYTISGTNVLVSVTGVLNDNITWNVITKVNTVA